ncbi:2-hydroxyhepta-2,4-diene-1,7-dioate isomerase [Comamonas serinivorans]|uniref:2-hydroxyhepta-2,4-diene-1,7-dioate isomerase n=1 Tax=Comamonas serinivorans TaxID=1082851 RepID=A0A1Y0ERJ8_9BURK|nr:fumarylacetoacetate hydrolase family protein [Comamonas serinivorans]ARU06284.1 2-hydroxyhepta-2,4-diene-1,7-dioate isomerase [Comamonas serinivorans]
MKLVRFGPMGQEKPGVLDEDGRLRDLSGVVADIDAETLSSEGLAKLAKRALKRLPLVGGNPRLGCPVASVGKLIGIGLNYADHAAETGLPEPKEPVVFLKATSCIQGPNDPIVLPKGSTHTDWEVELAVVIGTLARHVSKREALSHVAGYTIVNDVSERQFQMARGGTWDKGKGCDTFGPIGPWLVTRDEVPQPQKLDLWLAVNGVRMQASNTRHMIFSVAELVSHVSQFMSLHPGDVIATGTPAGVGMGRHEDGKPSPRFLRKGDVLTLGVAGLGEQRAEVMAYPR